MSSPLYEIAADALSMPGILCEWGYWSTRANWGLSERDIINGTLASASLGAIALYSYAHPEARAPGALDAFLAVPHLGRWSESIHRERWFLMLRLVLIAATLIVIGSILLSAPRLISQDNFRAERFFDQEVRIRAMELNNERLNARLDTLRIEVSEIKENIIWARNAMFTLLGGFAIFLAKEFFTLLMSAVNIITGKKKAD